MKARYLASNSMMAAAIAAFCNMHAFAQEKARSLDEVLTQDQGMTQVSEGLWARTSPASESYVAVGKAGHAALLEKLIELRPKISPTQAQIGAAAQPSLLDQAIGDLDAMHLDAKQTVIGSCAGPGSPGEPELRAIANSSGGTTASASAVMTKDFGPATNTTNFARAETVNRQGVTTSSQSDTEHFFTQASASASAPVQMPCSAAAWATVTCPTGGPGISAFSSTLVFSGCML